VTAEERIKCVRAQRINWWGYLNKMEKTKRARKITEWKPIGVRSKGLPKYWWEMGY
jgi:hypothetical protein